MTATVDTDLTADLTRVAKQWRHAELNGWHERAESHRRRLDWLLEQIPQQPAPCSLTVRLFGLDLLEITATTSDTDNSESAPFGFSGSGSGIVELSTERALDYTDG